MDCRCDDPKLRELTGEEAEQYSRHLERIAQGRGQDWLLRCPITMEEVAGYDQFFGPTEWLAIINGNWSLYDPEADGVSAPTRTCGARGRGGSDEGARVRVADLERLRRDPPGAVGLGWKSAGASS